MRTHDSASRVDGTLVGPLLTRAHRLAHCAIEGRFDVSDVTYAQWMVLKSLEGGVTPKMKDEAGKLNLSTASLSRIVSGLFARGFVESQACEAQTGADITLTAQGRIVFEEAFGVIKRRWDHALAGLSEMEVHHLITLLGKLNTGLESIRTSSSHPAEI